MRFNLPALSVCYSRSVSSPCRLSRLMVRSHRISARLRDSPVGRWKTIDDNTGKVKSIVAIRKEAGKLYGKIETLFDPPVPNPTCYLCSGAAKDRPLVGLQILWGFKQDGDHWSGGQVLDPESGRIYRLLWRSKTAGRSSDCAASLVFLLGRTEYWLRAK